MEFVYRLHLTLVQQCRPTRFRYRSMMYALLAVIVGSSMHVSNGLRSTSTSPSPFASVTAFFGLDDDTLPRKQTMLLIRNVLYRVRCERSGIDCKKCLDVDSVFSYLNRSHEESLDETSFRTLSIVLVTVMTDIKSECPQSQARFGIGLSSLTELFHKLTGNKPSLSRNAVVSILTAINQEYRFGSVVLDSEGVIIPSKSEVIDFTTNFQCFSPRSLYNRIEKPAESELNIRDAQSLASYIVLNVLEGHCISIDDKPSPYSFLADLFAVFGDKTKSMLDHEEFENLLEALNLGPETHALPKPTKKTKRDLHTAKINMNCSMGRQRSVDMTTSDNMALGPCIRRYCRSGVDSFLVAMRNISALSNGMELPTLYPKLMENLLAALSVKKEAVLLGATTLSEAYGYGALATGIISSSPLVGIIGLKMIGSGPISHIMSVLMAISVSALTGDALLHLLPQAAGLTSKMDGLPIDQLLLKMVAILGSFYLFATVQMLLVSIHRRRSYDISLDSESNTAAPKSGTDTGVTPTAGSVGMVTLGHAVHNFIDGVALGAAFTVGLSSGLSTSIAILSHELPHGLGDFSTLISAGLSTKKALLMTFVSSVTAFIGLAIGVPLAEYSGGKEWVLLFTAGIFLYVSLANVTPELLNKVQSSDCVWLTLGLVNFAMLLGYGIMFTIAIFEEHIHL